MLALSRGAMGMNGPPEPLAESGVYIGLAGTGEKEPVWSLKTLGSDGLLAEWKGRWPCVKSTKASSISEFVLSSGLITGSAGDAMPLGEVGEMPVGLWMPDAGFDVSESPPIELFRDLPPMLFFCLNFSSQLALLAFWWLSGPPTVVAKKRAFSLIAASEIVRFCFCWLRIQFSSARSMSGNLPFCLRAGDRLPSSWYRYFSF